MIVSNNFSLMFNSDTH